MFHGTGETEAFSGCKKPTSLKKERKKEKKRKRKDWWGWTLLFLVSFCKAPRTTTMRTNPCPISTNNPPFPSQSKIFCDARKSRFNVQKSNIHDRTHVKSTTLHESRSKCSSLVVAYFSSVGVTHKLLLSFMFLVSVSEHVLILCLIDNEPW